MAEVVQVSALWAPPVLATLGALALAGASLEGALVARGAGRAVRPGAEAPLVSAARLMRQRRTTTLSADRPLWRLGGGGLVVAAALMVAVVPIGPWTLLDSTVGIVWFNAMDVLVWALVWLLGWGANSAHALIGGYRFLALAMAYELPLMFALSTPAVAAGSLRVGDVVAAQTHVWNALWMPLAFVVYCVGVAAFSTAGPFGAAAGTDLGGGVLAETSGVDRLLVLAGRWALLAAGALFAVPLFLGGASWPGAGAGPGTGAAAGLLGALSVLVKAALLLAALVWLRRRVPLLRPDKLMEVGWLLLLPAALLQLLAVSVVVVVRG